MAVSTIPAAKDALYDLIVADASVVAAKVQVSYGWPSPHQARELIWIGDVEGEQNAAALGKQRREETYKMTLKVDVLREGNDQKSASERAFVIAGWIENILRNDATLGGVVRTAEIEGPLELKENATDKARNSGGTLSIYCTARI